MLRYTDEVKSVIRMYDSMYLLLCVKTTTSLFFSGNKMSAVVRNLEEIREFWNMMAEFYAQVSVRFTRKLYHAFIPFLKLQDASVVVDAGCGPGIGISELLTALPPTAKVLANDICPKFVQIAQTKAPDRAEVIEANSEQLPFPDGVADRYVANLSLHLVEFPERLVSEAFRLLKPGGIAVFTVPSDPNLSTVTTLLTILEERFGKVVYRSYFHLSDPTVLRQLLTTAGFTRVILFREVTFVPILEAEGIEAMLMGSPELKELHAQASEDQKPQFLQCMRDYINNILVGRQEPMAVDCRIALAFKP